MSRKNGGIIGPANTPVGGLMKGVAGGVWRMNDVLDFVGNSQWPSAPQNIENSVRFNFNDDPRLARTLSTPTDADKYTFSTWVKRDRPTTSAQDYAYLISFDIGGTLREHIRFSTGGANDQINWYIRDSSNTATNLSTTPIFKDVSAWYHVCCAYDSTQSTSSNRQKIYVNGTEITSFSSSGYVSQNQDSPINTSGHAVKIGCFGNSAGTTANFSGYMAEIVFIDGQALDPTSFGEFDSTTGIWKPRKIGAQFGSGGAGNNGFYLDFKDSSSLGNDASGNNNDWTPSDLTSTDQATDTCVENFVTLNPLATTTTQGTVAEGNLEFDRSGSSDGWVSILSTIAASSGKYYAEVKIIDVGSPSQGCVLGFLNWDKTNIMSSSSTYLGAATADAGMGWYSVGNVFRQGGHVNIINSYTDNDIVMLAMDLDNGYCYFGKNGSWENSGDPTSGSTGTGGYATSNMTAGGTYCFAASCREAGNVQFNFGNPPFSISSGNADANGFGNFEYAPPSGYYALNTSNLNTYG